MGLDALRTCPRCLTRVLPRQDGVCPACNQFDFSTGVADEATVRAARDAAAWTARAQEKLAADLHWRLVFAIPATFVLLVLRVWVSHDGTGLFSDLFGGPPDREVVLTVITVALAGAAALMWASARRLAEVLRLASGGQRSPHPITVLKESMGFFEERKVPMTWLGPRLDALPDREEDEA